MSAAAPETNVTARTARERDMGAGPYRSDGPRRSPSARYAGVPLRAPRGALAAFGAGGSALVRLRRLRSVREGRRGGDVGCVRLAGQASQERRDRRDVRRLE